jgi:outer membrane biosynthesis protein TonB
MTVAAGAPAQQPGALPNAARAQLSEAATTAKIIYRVAPIYPTQARASHIEGTAVFRAIVAKDGSIVSLQDSICDTPPNANNCNQTLG